MANTGNISMAPIIAALQANVTAIMGPTWNPVTDSLDAAYVLAMHTDGDIGTIRVADLPALAAEHVTLAAEHVIIDDEIAAMQGNVTDILVDTDATIPAAITAKKVKGALKRFQQSTSLTDYQTVIDITGSGMLLWVQVDKDASAQVLTQITIDGVVYTNLCADAGTKWLMPVLDPDGVNDNTWLYHKAESIDVTAAMLLMWEYQSGLKVEFKAGTAFNVDIRGMYTEI